MCKSYSVNGKLQIPPLTSLHALITSTSLDYECAPLPIFLLLSKQKHSNAYKLNKVSLIHPRKTLCHSLVFLEMSNYYVNIVLALYDKE